MAGRKGVNGIGINRFAGRGKVIFVRSYHDFERIRGGEVVVTTNATPDYILILNKLKCLITDEGGVTSHIAIICRELSVPAIVATGNATRALAEGSVVYFDTGSGEAWIGHDS